MPDSYDLLIRLLTFTPHRVSAAGKITLTVAEAQARLSDDSMPRRMLGLSVDEKIVVKYIKPHGHVLKDGRIICWGRAHSWKTIPDE